MDGCAAPARFKVNIAVQFASAIVAAAVDGQCLSQRSEVQCRGSFRLLHNGSIPIAVGARGKLSS